MKKSFSKIIDYLKSNFNEYHFVALWTLINIIQIYFTELTSDEAYYWFYSTKLEWGYYDHPPMIALLTRLGTFFFTGELGVRLFNVLLFSGGIVFLFKILPDISKNKFFIFLLLLSIPLFNYISFVIFPDTALVSFSIFALYAYKRLLEKNTLKSSLIFGLSLAFMYYSKYHSVLIVFFILLSNLKLLN